MSDIADVVGIKKPSLYSHFNSKDDLFLAIFLDLAEEYKEVISRMCDKAGAMETENALFYLFDNYIAYFINNPKKSSFWNRVLVFTPTTLYEKVNKIASESDIEFRNCLEKIFKKGIIKGVLKKGNINDMILSYGCLRTGLVSFLQVNTGVKKDRVRAVWEDYWFGIKG